MKFVAVASAAISTILFATPLAEAHVTANPSAAVSGSYFQTSFRVPHGCDGNATNLVIVEIPKGVSSVKPRPLYPWNTTISMVPLDTPITTPTGTINTTVGSITWSNGLIQDNMYEDFGLQFKLPTQEGPLYWKVYQHCVNNEWNNWTSVPDANGKTDGFPAAVITLSNSTTTTGPGGASPSASSKPSAAVAAFQSLNFGRVALISSGAFLVALI
ncbi:hypothetical protein BX616_006740 [Lobosporangium transversale]|uniref:YncI copper-binding domain-containing protein n=1 Tax=Lobosporangium transversale TaxID=64571 RepID=A0A1Y2GQ57_9FUNG|nr:hypothetical protein BCR41DRAFT_421907 [Lobosporangium transversale]KAF9915168.1 hypothetical protein BX616_006740 [Lobosporangium transversale]ORZ16724.1 hypothetical protein BCR41DRAFT_421907 [Lobosporangium transversale]|eukprot:XP_021881659.1 hypothetical protein BCR41DRAFT_421907 [Lobosporangium transversale]